ncbi:MAG: hypothetical protein AUK47_19815 [Deltaproteobacteria bacterium CG2_30_63_29]|nr:MAG: hypothetical protein AUK47_19815 [Deltaproteobacteria bacterium CG2_30_63_29]PJB47315.1 MAG: hypothetical protein CO108_04315 [Deltaproteobacteria bacterium CG_4_9_14_3_um_filter_63_12]
MATETIRAVRYYQRGVYFFEREQWADAVSNLRDSVTLYPELISARMVLGVALARQRLYLDAVRVLEEGRHFTAVDDQLMLKLLRLLGIICILRQDFPAAQYYLSEALEIAPNDPRLLNKLAATQCKSGNFVACFDLFLESSRQTSAPVDSDV